MASTGVIYVSDYGSHCIRSIHPDFSVQTVAGSGAAGAVDAVGALASFNLLYGLAVDAKGLLYVADTGNFRIRTVSDTATVSTVVGGSMGFLNAFGSAARFLGPQAVAITPASAIYVAETGNNIIRLLTCIPCPASFYCASGAPVICPAGAFCPLSSITATPCPAGTASAVIGAASNAACALCPAGRFSSAAGSPTCSPCPGGHFCPAGTASWARLSCGRGNYCPDGSGAKTPCPFQVPPTGGWGALQEQGPAFLVDTAHCLNHCFWNFTSGDGMLSKC